jgi:hypothetical protein
MVIINLSMVDHRRFSPGKPNHLVPGPTVKHSMDPSGQHPWRSTPGVNCHVFRGFRSMNTRPSFLFCISIYYSPDHGLCIAIKQNYPHLGLPIGEQQQTRRACNHYDKILASARFSAMLIANAKYSYKISL